ncbi:MAG TPA: hypothetical protein VFQ34_02115 [Nitrospiraceae bacterium]|nr:hypothetical protein [Nitrospiraceae bacterium]
MLVSLLAGVLILLSGAAAGWAEMGFDEKYERDYNIFNPINQYRPDNPLNPAQAYSPDNPFNPVNKYDPGNPTNPINKYHPNNAETSMAFLRWRQSRYDVTEPAVHTKCGVNAPFNAVNRYDPANPLNPVNKYNPTVPFGPLEEK